ncbi:MAG: haloacid dehalogenase [Acidimicrobiia bacterium]|nr:haloacid dehalogenase [Acidimicrobiia bacterium]
MTLGLDPVGAQVRGELDAKFEAREQALRNCRMIIQSSSKAIRALHRGEMALADDLISGAVGLIGEIEPALASHPDIYHAGFFYDAVKEYAEAAITRALVAGDALPPPSVLGVHAVPYLKGLGEAVGEMRRRLLDQLRDGDLDAADATFGAMDEVVDFLMELDYPDGMTSGLRRTTDVARSLVERSRSDLTTAALQERYRRDLA